MFDTDAKLRPWPLLFVCFTLRCFTVPFCWYPVKYWNYRPCLVNNAESGIASQLSTLWLQVTSETKVHFLRLHLTLWLTTVRVFLQTTYLYFGPHIAGIARCGLCYRSVFVCLCVDDDHGRRKFAQPMQIWISI